MIIEKGMYYPTDDFKNTIRSLGGEWNDTKDRPLVCLIESYEQDGLYWAIPMGKLNHRDTGQIQRIYNYMNKPFHDLRSCYYHIGRTTSKSIFFISDVVPISEKYIDREHFGADNKLFIIKNKKLVSELYRKLTRILQFENHRPNYFRQHISDVKTFIIKELKQDKTNNT